MLRRSDGVECRFGGEHTVRTERLHITIPRLSEQHRIWPQLVRDAAAQHWLGPPTAPDPPPTTRFGVADPLLISPTYLAFVGYDPQTGYPLAMINLGQQHEAGMDIGGVVDPAFRQRGFGREILTAVCAVAHHHFGIARLRAGVEVTNEASLRWLASCGFAGFDAPRRETLPHGREADVLWWYRTDQSAKRRCRNPAT